VRRRGEDDGTCHGNGVEWQPGSCRTCPFASLSPPRASPSPRTGGESPRKTPATRACEGGNAVLCSSASRYPHFPPHSAPPAIPSSPTRGPQRECRQGNGRRAGEGRNKNRKRRKGAARGNGGRGRGGAEVGRNLSCLNSILIFRCICLCARVSVILTRTLPRRRTIRQTQTRSGRWTDAQFR
jgi:hypothetical protein